MQNPWRQCIMRALFHKVISRILKEGKALATVSVIVPVYNVESYLEKCVNSVLNQSFRDWELILVDDGSTDSSGKLCDVLQQGDDRVRVIHQENAGLGGARNTGIQAAEGTWLLFVDSDDAIEPHTLEKALETAEETGSELVFFSFASVTEEGLTQEVFHPGLPTHRPLTLADTPRLLLAGPSAWNKLYKASLFLDSGVRFPGRVWYEDIRTTLKLLPKAACCGAMEEVCYRYLLREGSITKNSNADRNGEILEAFEDLLGFYKEQGLFEQYRDELCYLTIFHVYLAASVRVLRIDSKHRLLGAFREYLRREFPAYRENPYLKELGRNRRLIFALLEKKLYFLVALLFKLKG